MKGLEAENRALRKEVVRLRILLGELPGEEGNDTEYSGEEESSRCAESA